VLVWHDIIGLRPTFRDMGRRLGLHRFDGDWWSTTIRVAIAVLAFAKLTDWWSINFDLTVAVFRRSGSHVTVSRHSNVRPRQSAYKQERKVGG
jgi:hypothetical protein